VGNHLVYKVKEILKSRNLKTKEKEYIIKWQGYFKNKSTWVLAKDMGNAKKIIENFKQDKGSNKSQCRH
jgi:hypothetical protein